MKKIFSANPVFWFVYLFLRGKSSRWSEPHEIDIQTKKLPCYFSRNLLPTLKVGKNVL